MPGVTFPSGQTVFSQVIAHDRQLILNRYRPIAQAGSGGFGTVHVAWDTRIQRKVAIKCIELDEFEAARAVAPEAGASSTDDSWGTNPDGAFVSAWNDEEEGRAAVGADDLGGRPAAGCAPGPEPIPEPDPAEEFEHFLSNIPGLDEARTAAMLSDPSIVTVFDFEVQGTTAYLIMEYVEGLTLTQLLRRHNDEIDLDIVAAVFASVSHALEVAHANHVLHLDIKPDNILINCEGQTKVTDFGLATLMDATGSGRAGGGTIGYMPLEQMRQEPLDERCDEWALASVTYEMLVGKNPFLAPHLAAAELAIVEGELVLPSLCWDDLDDAADDVVFYALDPDREERYDTVAEFAEELQPLLGDPDVGMRKLAALVGDGEPEEEEEAAGEEPAARRWRRYREHVPLRDRITSRKRTVAAHVVGGLGSAGVAALAATNIPVVSGVGAPAFAAVVAVAAVLGVVWPHFGALLAYLLLAVAMIVQGSTVLGVVLAAATVAWWYFIGRQGKAAANVALACPALAGFGLGQLVPLTGGFVQKPLQALATCGFCALVCATLAACGTGDLLWWNALANASFAYAGVVQESLLGLLQKPAFWCVVASWLAAAFVLAIFRRRPTRPFAAFGTLCAVAVLLVGLIAGAALSSGFATWLPSTGDVLCTLAAAALMLAACVLLPERGRDD